MSRIEKDIKADLVYSILAPSYFFFKTTEVMRCCNAWDLIPKSHVAYKSLNNKTRIEYSLRAIAMKALMRRTKYFITQTSTAKDGIAKLMNLSGDSIRVVANVLPLVFNSVEPEKKQHDNINIVYVAAYFPHKNVDIVPNVASILKNKYGIANCRFQLTVPFNEHNAVKSLEEAASRLGVSDMIVNKGRLKQSDLSSLYNESDIGFFPSLLETFSATLLEYMKFGLPIVASDNGFNRDVTSDAALYFEPRNAEEAAKKLSEIILNKNLRDKLSKESKKRITLFDSFDRYYNETVDFFTQVTTWNKNKWF